MSACHWPLSFGSTWLARLVVTLAALSVNETSSSLQINFIRPSLSIWMVCSMLFSFYPHRPWGIDSGLQITFRVNSDGDGLASLIENIAESETLSGVALNY
jgi:hypothetical protein